MPETARIVVVGGGFAGLESALKAGSKGMSTTLARR